MQCCFTCVNTLCIANVNCVHSVAIEHKVVVIGTKVGSCFLVCSFRGIEEHCAVSWERFHGVKQLSFDKVTFHCDFLSTQRVFATHPFAFPTFLPLHLRTTPYDSPSSPTFHGNSNKDATPIDHPLQTPPRTVS